MNGTLVIGISGRKQSGKNSLARMIEAYYTVNYLDSEFDDYRQLDNGDIEMLSNGEVKFVINEGNEGVVSGGKVSVYSFADPLKRICIDLLGLEENQCYGTDKQKNSKTDIRWDNLPKEIRRRYFDPCGGCSSCKCDGMKSGYMSGREVMQVLGTDIMRNMFHQNIWVDVARNEMMNSKSDIVLITDVRFISEVEVLMDMNIPDIGVNNSRVIRLTRVFDKGESHSSEKDLNEYDWSQHGDNAAILDNSEKHITGKNNIALDYLVPILKEKFGVEK